MHVTLRTQGVELNEDQRREIGRRLMSALDRHQSRITEVKVFVSDVNGPRGGIDKVCQISATMKGHPPLKVLERSGNFITGLTKAGRRLGLQIAESKRSRRRPASKVHGGLA